MNIDDQKNINLMPENLRSKKFQVSSKSKTKEDFSIDLVMPKDIAKQKSDKPSFLKNLKKLFKKEPHFGESIKGIKKSESKIDKQSENNIKGQGLKAVKPKIEKPSQDKFKQESKITLHIPENKLNKDNDLDFDLLDNPQIKEKKISPSFWGKFAKLFKSKKKKESFAKIKIIEPQKKIEPLKEAIKKESVREIKKVEAKKIESEPIGSSVNIEASKNLADIKSKQVDESQGISVPKLEKKESNFSIPALEVKENNNHSEPDNTNKKSDKEKIKFHHPQTKIRAKLLDDGGGVDLIPDAAKTRSWRQVISLISMALLISTVIIGGIYAYLIYQSKNIEQQQKTKEAQITDLERQVLTYVDINNDITALGEDIITVNKLLNFHFYWTNFFELLEKYTISDVYYSGLSAGNGGLLTLNAVGTDFDSVARQLKVLQQEEAQEFVTAIDISSADYDSDSNSISFSMTLSLNPSLFMYNNNLTE